MNTSNNIRRTMTDLEIIGALGIVGTGLNYTQDGQLARFQEHRHLEQLFVLLDYFTNLKDNIPTATIDRVKDAIIAPYRRF